MTLLALALLICCMTISATPDDKIPAQCAKMLSVTQQDAVALTWEVGSGRRVEVVSADGKEHRLRVQLGDLGLRDADGKSLPAAQFIKVEPQTATLTKEGVQLSVTVERITAVKPGVYSGSLILSEDTAGSNGCSERISVRLTVPNATPLTDKLTLHAYRLFPLVSYWVCWECSLPLKSAPDAKTAALRPNVPLGGIQNKDGGAAAVFWTGGQPTSSDGFTGLPVSVQGLDKAGQYEGQIGLGAAGDKAGSVGLTLDASDIALWPLLVIAFSIWLGLLAQRYVNVVRIILRLREQEAALGLAFEDSQQRFTESVRATPSVSYSITADLNAQRERLRQQITNLGSGAALTLDTTSAAYTAIIEALTNIKEAIAAWGGFGQDLSSLRAALGTADDAGVSPPGFNDTTNARMPVLLMSLAKLLVGESLTLVDFTQRRAQVREATAAARLWYSLRDRIEQQQRRFTSLFAHRPTMNADQQVRLDAAGQRISELLLGLWEVAAVTELNAFAASPDLGATEQDLRALASEINSTPPAAPSAASMVSLLMAHGDIGLLPGAFTVEVAPPAAPADDTARERFFADALRRGDRRLALLAFFVAALTGLYNNYMGKPFGTLKDYVGLLILGLGTKVAIDAVSAAFGRLFGGTPSDKFSGRA
jgi:hypothetical protein